MKIRSCSQYVIIAATLLVLVSGPFGPGRSGAAEPEKSDKTEQAEPIRITADRLTTDNQKHSAVFEGHVTAVQGDARITTDRLTIFYKSKSGEASAGANDIERLEAQGNVRIFFDNRLAVSNQAVYIMNERKLILEGPESKVVSGQDEIVGSRIVFDRNTGHMTLESDGGKQVEAVIHSDQRGLK